MIWNHSKFLKGRRTAASAMLEFQTQNSCLEGASMPEAERRRRAPPSQIQITFTLRAKDQFSKERGRKRRRRPRGQASGGSGERRALERGGPGAPGGSGDAGRGCRGSGGGSGERRPAAGGQGGRNGRPPGHVTRPGPRRPPSFTAALPRPGGGPEVMPALGDAEPGPARARGRDAPGGSGPGCPRDRAPPRAPPRPSGHRCHRASPPPPRRARDGTRSRDLPPAPWSPRPPAPARKWLYLLGRGKLGRQSSVNPLLRSCLPANK